MTSSMQMLPNGVERLETLSNLCALEIAHQGMLDNKRALLLEEGLLAAGVSGAGQSGLLSNGVALEQTVNQNPQMCDMLVDSGDHNQSMFGENVNPEEARSMPLVRSKKADQAARIKRPMNPFMIWAKGERSTILGQNPTMHNSDVSRQLGRNWRGMSIEEKRPYILAAERLAEEHRRLHPNYKYRPRKKDPNVQRVRGRRLDSEALNRVAKALTKQEISACVSGNASFLRRAARPSSVALSSQPKAQKYDPYSNQHGIFNTASLSGQSSTVKKEYVVASAPVTPVREVPMLSSQQRRLSQPEPPMTGYERNPRERGWYSCPPSPSSFSSKPYPRIQSGAIMECKGENLGGTTHMESPQTEELSSPPPLVDSTRYQSPTLHNCPPPPLMNVPHQAHGNSHQQVNTSSAQPTLQYQRYSPDQQHQQQRFQENSPTGHMLYHRNQSQQSTQHLNHPEQSNHTYSHHHDVSPPADHHRARTPAEDTSAYQPILRRNADQPPHPPPRDSNSPTQISNLATKILTIMVKRGDDESTGDEAACRSSSTSPSIKYANHYEPPQYTGMQNSTPMAQPFYQNEPGRQVISTQPPPSQSTMSQQLRSPVEQQMVPTHNHHHLQQWPAPSPKPLSTTSPTNIIQVNHFLPV